MDQIKSLLQFKMFGYPIWIFLAAGAALYAVMTVWQKIEQRADKKGTNLFRKVICAKCGWKGSVSRHKPKCGKCGSTSMNDQ